MGPPQADKTCLSMPDYSEEVFLHVLHGIQEQSESVWFFIQTIPGPIRVLVGFHVAFRVGHHAQYPTRRIAYPRNILHRAVWIVRVSRPVSPLIYVPEDYL